MISAGRLHSCTYGSVEFSGRQILKYCIQQTFFGFLNVDEKEKSCKLLLCSSMQFCSALDIGGKHTLSIGNVFYSTFTNVFYFCHVFYVFNVFIFI